MSSPSGPLSVASWAFVTCPDSRIHTSQWHCPSAWLTSFLCQERTRLGAESGRPRPALTWVFQAWAAVYTIGSSPRSQFVEQVLAAERQDGLGHLSGPELTPPARSRIEARIATQGPEEVRPHGVNRKHAAAEGQLADRSEHFQASACGQTTRFPVLRICEPLSEPEATIVERLVWLASRITTQSSKEGTQQCL
jgi:hypothetical protein